MQPFPSVERNELVGRGSEPADHRETARLLVNELQPYVTASEFEAAVTNEMSCTCRKAPIPNSSTGVSERCLTLFYAGTVNVFDNVPQEKAEAIMKLAACHAASDHENPFPVPVKDRNYYYYYYPVMHNAPANPISVPAAGGHDANLEIANFLHCDASVPTALRLAQKVSLAQFLRRRKTRLMALNSPKEKCFISSGNDGGSRGASDAVLFGRSGREREKVGHYYAHGFSLLKRPSIFSSESAK